MQTLPGVASGAPGVATVRSPSPSPSPSSPPSADGSAQFPAQPPRFNVLGPLHVFGDRLVPITARRQQIVLALLLLNGNRTVPLETLVDALWDHCPPVTARAQVQTCVSALRRALLSAGLGERIHLRGGGYDISVGPAELDLLVFERLMAAGRTAAAANRPAQARAAFREALALWRGEPLAGIDSDAIQGHKVRIGERRVEAIEECIDSELRLGRHHEVVGEISTMVAEHPLRERLVKQLMTALHQCGRRAEALAVYRNVRQQFVEELGLEPGHLVSRAHQEILNGSPVAEEATPAPTPTPMPVSEPAPVRVPIPVPVPVPRMLPARIPYFTGHCELLKTLCSRLVENRGSDAGLVTVLTGRGGAGKSAVANEAANEVAAAFPDGQLYARMAAGGDRIENVSNVLKQFLSALGFPLAQIPAEMEDRAAVYRSAIAGRRMLTVVDDVADEALLRPLVPGTSSCRLLVTTRARTAPLLGSAVFELDVFSPEEGVELLAAMIGRERIEAEGRAAAELVRLCGGLPLAVCSAASRLVARPHWTIGDFVALLRDERGRLDQLDSRGFDIRESFRRGCLGLSPAARHLFAQLGLLESSTFSARVAAQLLAPDAGPVSEALESLVDARLADIVTGSGAAAHYRMHELVRIFARECVFRDGMGRSV
ncbi:BTAD domain-containing putative transcriptional regulator [Catenulispora sp. EB89]|uniref:AfsR/SARP family transcriptional regulator n=1 Tax=Catenulispora sp. EB89 TaxID=3156257 RepID=UPI003514492D